MPLDTLSDSTLVVRLRRRDEAAVAELLRRHWPAAYRTSLALVRDPDQAEDTAQEAMLAVLRSVDRFREDGPPFRAWLLGVVRNVAMKQHRTADRRARHEARSTPATSSANPVADAETREQVGRLRDLLPTLNPDQRLALSLRYLDELSLAEIAQVQGCAEGTVSSRIRLGLESLRRVLAPASAGAVGVLVASALDVPVPAAPAASLLTALDAATPLDSGPEGLVASGLPQAASLGPKVAVAAGILALSAGAAFLINLLDTSRSAPHETAAASPSPSLQPPATPTPAGGSNAPPGAQATPVTPGGDESSQEPHAVAAAPQGSYLRVVDAQGHPAQADVFLVEGHEWFSRNLLRRLRYGPYPTDPNGRFHVEEQWASAYVARRGLERALAEAPRASAWPEGDLILTLLPPERPRAGLANVTGVLRSASGPLANMRIPATLAYSFERHEQGEVQTDAAGRYVIHDLTPGRFRLQLRPPDYGARIVEVTTRGDQATVLDVTFEAASELRGSVRGSVPEAPRSEVRLWSEPHDGLALEGKFEDGSYTVAGIAPGEYWLELAVPGRGPRKERVTIREPGVTIGPTFDLSQGVTVHGRLLDANGTPFPSGGASLLPRSTPLSIWASGPFAPDGAFQIEGVLPGDYVLQFNVPTGPDQDSRRKMDREVAVHVSDTDVDVKTIRSKISLKGSEKASIVGQVLGRDGEPVAKARVYYTFEPSGSSFELADAEGRFQLSLAPGEHHLWAVSQDSALITARGTRVVGDPAQATRVVLTLGRAARVVGRVQASAGHFNSAMLVVQPYFPLGDPRGFGRSTPNQGRVRADGSFVIVGLAPGPYRVVLLGQGHDFAVDLAPGEERRLEFDLRDEIHELTVRARGLPESARGDLRFSATWRNARNAPCEESGYFPATEPATLRRLPPGPIEVKATSWKGGQLSVIQTVELVPGTPLDLVLEWPADAPKGSASGRASPRAEMIQATTTWKGNTLRAARYRKKDGTFALSGLPAGLYRIRATDRWGTPVGPEVEVLVTASADADVGLLPLD